MGRNGLSYEDTKILEDMLLTFLLGGMPKYSSEERYKRLQKNLSGAVSSITRRIDYLCQGDRVSLGEKESLLKDKEFLLKKLEDTSRDGVEETAFHIVKLSKVIMKFFSEELSAF